MNNLIKTIVLKNKKRKLTKLTHKSHHLISQEINLKLLVELLVLMRYPKKIIGYTEKVLKLYTNQKESWALVS